MSDVDILEGDLRTASTIIEWEFGDIIGHVGVRLPDRAGIAVKLLRVAQEDRDQDWLMHFDFEGNKLSGTGTVPGEAPIYTQIFKARPDVNSIVHAHAPMSIVLGLAGIPVSPVHFQSSRFGGELPIFPMPSYVSEVADGDALAAALGDAPGITINGHGIVTVGTSIDQACLNAMYMERTAKIMHAAMLVGFRGVSEEFQGMLLENRSKVAERGKHLGRPKTDHSDEWRYYARKIEHGESWNRGFT